MSRSWAWYKLSVGYTIWDNNCGILPDLEDTLNWRKAVVRSKSAEAMIETTDRHAYHGTIIAWCGQKHPVLLRGIKGLGSF